MTDYADLSNLAEILKNVYGDGLTNQFNDEVTTYNLFPKSDRRPAGNGYIFGIRYARTQSTGGRAESAKLPAPLTGVKDQGKINARYLYGSIRLTGPAIETAKNNVAAFVDGLADEMDDIYQSIINDMNRQAWGDGFGLIGTLSAAMTPSTSTTFTGTFDNDRGIQYFQEGMLLDFHVAAGTSAVTTCCGQRVDSINPVTKVVTFKASGQTYLTDHPNATIAAYTNDATEVPISALAVKMGARDAAFLSTDTPTEITGMMGLFDDGTLLASFENITVASYPKWKANILSNSAVNRDLSLELLLQACDVTRIRSGKKVSRIYMGLGQRRKYALLLMPDVRFAPTVLKGGYETLSFSGGDGTIEMVVDPLCQPNRMFMESGQEIKKYELTPLGWGNLDGSNMNRRAGYDEWDLFLRLYTNLGVEQRNSLTLLSDLVEPSLY